MQWIEIRWIHTKSTWITPNKLRFCMSRNKKKKLNLLYYLTNERTRSYQHLDFYIIFSLYFRLRIRFDGKAKLDQSIENFQRLKNKRSMYHFLLWTLTCCTRLCDKLLNITFRRFSYCFQTNKSSGNRRTGQSYF